MAATRLCDRNDFSSDWPAKHAQSQGLREARVGIRSEWSRRLEQNLLRKWASIQNPKKVRSECKVKKASHFSAGHGDAWHRRQVTSYVLRRHASELDVHLLVPPVGLMLMNQYTRMLIQCEMTGNTDR